MKKLFTLIVSCSVLGASFSRAQVQAAEIKKVSIPSTLTLPVDKGWNFEKKPFWSDEFNYSGLPDSTKWGYDIGGDGWGK